MSNRLPRINELIKKYVSEILARELDLKPGLFLTLSKVDTTPDLRYTRIFVSVFPEQEENYAMKTLKKEAYRIQGVLNKKLHLKILPRIEFFSDHTESRADKIEKILKNINT